MSLFHSLPKSENLILPGGWNEFIPNQDVKVKSPYKLMDGMSLFSSLPNQGVNEKIHTP